MTATLQKPGCSKSNCNQSDVCYQKIKQRTITQPIGSLFEMHRTLILNDQNVVMDKVSLNRSSNHPIHIVSLVSARCGFGIKVVNLLGCRLAKQAH